MKQATNLGELFAKLNDLKSLFHYGQKMIPIIQNLIDFMGETVPLLENINQSIAESTAKIPKATNQITNVTSANELATTEILDTVDAISSDIFNSEIVINNVIKTQEQKVELYNQLKEQLKGNDKAEGTLAQIISLDETVATVKPLLEIFDKIKTGAYNITLSLQVQDITAQQLAAVNHLIESVQSKLSSLLTEFSEADVKEVKVNKFEFSDSTKAAFNPDARYEDMKETQQMADELINKTNLTTASQDEIDKLFS
ncbi:MAG: hypothetical protein Q8903_02530 [Bacteroidota bacterium]|nr:hypothetical protein [Bacteroidota bacterium]